MADNYALRDCVEWLSEHALHHQDLFTSSSVPDCKRLLALRRSYNRGIRALRRDDIIMDAMTVANFMLLGLSGPFEPLFGHAARQQLLDGVSTSQRSPRSAALRGILDDLPSHQITRVFLLFQFLHHHWVNQEDRAASLQQMAFLFAPMLFATPVEANSCGDTDSGPGVEAKRDDAAEASTQQTPAIEEKVVLASATAFLISNFRALFGQPANLERWREDGVDADEQTEAGQDPGQELAEQVSVPCSNDCNPASACVLACCSPSAPPTTMLLGSRSPCLTRCSSSEAEDEELGRCLDVLLSQLITEYVAPGSSSKRGNQPGSPTDVLTDVCTASTPVKGLQSLASGDHEAVASTVSAARITADAPVVAAPGIACQSSSPAATRWADLRVRTTPQ